MARVVKVTCIENPHRWYEYRSKDREDSIEIRSYEQPNWEPCMDGWTMEMFINFFDLNYYKVEELPHTVLVDSKCMCKDPKCKYRTGMA